MEVDEDEFEEESMKLCDPDADGNEDDCDSVNEPPQW